MKLKGFWLSAIVIAACNGMGFLFLYLSKTYFFPMVTFKDNLGNLGSSLVTYSTAMMALLIAMVVIIFGLMDLACITLKKRLSPCYIFYLYDNVFRARLNHGSFVTLFVQYLKY